MLFCRQYRGYTQLPNFQVASEEDVQDVLKSIFNNEEFKRRLPKIEKDDRKWLQKEVAYSRSYISNMKNFSESIEW
jgi:uncharacterized protein YktB (UPF0637 family)